MNENYGNLDLVEISKKKCSRTLITCQNFSKENQLLEERNFMDFGKVKILEKKKRSTILEL